MTTAQIVIVCLTVLAVAGVAAWLVRALVTDSTSTRLVLEQKKYDAERDAAQRAGALERAAVEEQSLVGRPVLINTTGATAVRGLVHADLPDRLTLRDATVLSAGTDAEAPVGGLLHVLRTRIDLVQEISAPAREGG